MTSSYSICLTFFSDVREFVLVLDDESERLRLGFFGIRLDFDSDARLSAANEHNGGVAENLKFKNKSDPKLKNSPCNVDT